jgi:hypothetical protein
MVIHAVEMKNVPQGEQDVSRRLTPADSPAKR